ncbi:hypothetical protein Q7P35_012151 [Cladosporium inversicolor]
MNISPFVYTHAKPYTFPPAAVVPLIGVTLTSATSALLTRCVEHSLWETILRDRSITPTGRSLTPEDASQQAQCDTVATGFAFAGFTSEISALNSLPDASMILASLSSMNNLSVPRADVCSQEDCYLQANISVLLAECVTLSQPWSCESPVLEARCSAFGNETCIAWTADTVLNFTTGPSSACYRRPSEEEWGRLGWGELWFD